MPRHEHVFESVSGAVSAASHMRVEDGYDLFRGQRRPWPVVSTLRRLTGKPQSEAVARLNQFINWAKKEAALISYKFSSDQAIAIAQHYGIPTPFIDFTTSIEVAQFFATESDRNDLVRHEDMSCIIAIKSAHLEAWIRERFQRTYQKPGPEILQLAIANLWRLETQAGVFLADHDLLDSYPWDYLLFPASSNAEAVIDSKVVYPNEKSDLELIIEQWFYHEKASSGTRTLLKTFEKAGMEMNAMRSSPTDGIGMKGIIRPEPHPSWMRLDGSWLRPTERFIEVQPKPGEILKISVRRGIDLDTIRSLVEVQLPLDSLVDLRSRSAEWQFVVDGSTDHAMSETLRRQWDALRIDGYSETQIVESFVMSISLAALKLGLISDLPRYNGSLGINDDVELLKTLFGYDLLVEYTGLVGYNRALVNAVDLRLAVREDINSYLPSDLYKHSGSTEAERMETLLIGIYKPSLLFDFHRFVDLYVRRIIPISVVFRPQMPLYPVLNLEVFGVP